MACRHVVNAPPAGVRWPAFLHPPFFRSTPPGSSRAAAASAALCAACSCASATASTAASTAASAACRTTARLTLPPTIFNV